MHTDARKIDNNSLIEGDICIIGAGAAGISMALEMIGTPFKVILLEGGGFEYEAEMQDLYKGKTTGQKYFPLQSARLHYFGGTTGHWAGFCSPFDPIDFKQRDWIPHSGWPITREDLDPYYARAQKNLDLGPYDYSLEYWQKQDPERIPLPLDDKAVFNKMWQFSKPTRFGEKYKATIVKAPNVHLYTYANVTDITANEAASNVKEVTVKNLAGKQHTVRAKHFVLACCSIQNARMLLASNKQAPNGLGNQNDNVGRYFMEHIEIKSAEMWLPKPDLMKLYQWEWGVKARAELAISEEMQRKHKILNGTASLNPLAVAKNWKPMIETWTADTAKTNALMSGAKKALKEGPKLKSYNSFELFTRIEQAPNPNSRVTLDKEKDALGVPRANLHWEFTDLEKHSLRKIYQIIGEQVGISNAGRVKLMEYLRDENDSSWPAFTGGGWHHMGTTRMADDPKKGVVDKHCKVHGIANLYVAGAACYATAAAPNPTLTVTALSIRLAEHLMERMKAV
ncbi:GMC family oxidoreductase [Mucilaginibacter conchicola]|uniref:GMC family oxidoreductase n=1 Tax=Mucilaginibacter conchicola TaxID=2303333 RepID=A0A372NP75_9SPHI|nr:GMC family oxidoreductase [Mucilaginibacter conchicola]RFZ90732.1 GMC family oxidoreductase [Mucilaginibacter conchicola]